MDTFACLVPVDAFTALNGDVHVTVSLDVSVVGVRALGIDSQVAAIKCSVFVDRLADHSLGPLLFFLLCRTGWPSPAVELVLETHPAASISSPRKALERTA